VKLDIKAKQQRIPRDASGNPRFTRLYNTPNQGTFDSIAVLEVFTDAEVIELVNRCLYQLEYQSTAHKKADERRRVLLKSAEDKSRELYNTNYDLLTDNQQRTVLAELRKERKI
jgi:hypothetical protein